MPQSAETAAITLKDFEVLIATRAYKLELTRGAYTYSKRTKNKPCEKAQGK